MGLNQKSTFWIPTASDAIAIHGDLTRLFENESDPISPPGVKNLANLESACSRPHTAMGMTEKYPSIYLKLAALTHSLTKNHAFHNGNKRTALVALLTSLHRNGLCLRSSVSDDDVFNFIVAITEDTFPSARHGLSLDEVVRKIAWWIKNNSETLRDDTGTMKTSDFLNRCAQAGMIVKESGHKFVIVNPLAARSGKYRSICLNSSTRQLNGKTIMSFLRTLGLNAPNSGIDCNEFYDGAKVERAAIHRFIAALRRLAKT